MTKEKFYHVTVKLISDEEKPITLPQSVSIFLQRGFPLDLTRVVGPLDSKVKRDESLGHIWYDIKNKDKKYQIEIATELPYYLPNLKGEPEYILNVGDDTGFVCNRMTRVLFGNGLPEKDGQSYILIHRCGIPALLEIHKDLHPIAMHTFYSQKFILNGDTVEEAIENNFNECKDKIITNVNNIVARTRLLDPDKYKYLYPYPAISSYPIFWVAIQENEKTGCEQFTGDIRSVANRTLNDIKEEKSEEFLGRLYNKHEQPIYHSALALAYSYFYYGQHEQAIVQACTACEAILSMALEKHLLDKGLSKSQIEKALDDITFSQLLNLHLFNICDFLKLPSYQQIVGDANWARKRRNEIVHLGKSEKEMSKYNIKKSLEAIRQIITYIDDNYFRSIAV